MHRLRLALEPWQLPPEVGEEHVCHIVCEAAPHDDPERGEVLAVLREGVRRHLPTALPERVGDVEDGEVVDPVPDFEREDRELVAAGDQLEWAELLDLAREPGRDVAGGANKAPEISSPLPISGAEKPLRSDRNQSQDRLTGAESRARRTRTARQRNEY